MDTFLKKNSVTWIYFLLSKPTLPRNMQQSICMRFIIFFELIINKAKPKAVVRQKAVLSTLYHTGRTSAHYGKYLKRIPTPTKNNQQFTYIKLLHWSVACTNTHENQVAKTQSANLYFQDCDWFSEYSWDLIICISLKFSLNADSASPHTTLRR